MCVLLQDDYSLDIVFRCIKEYKKLIICWIMYKIRDYFFDVISLFMIRSEDRNDILE